MPNSSSSGNVLFLILIAVALFAALSFAITQSTRSTGGDVSKEKVQLLVNQMQQFKSSLTQAYTRLKLNGCTEENLYLYKMDGGTHQTWVNGTAGGTLLISGSTGVANSNCDIFSANGGGVILPYAPIQAPEYLVTFFNHPENRYYPISFDNQYDVVLTPANDVVALLQMSGSDDITVRVCEEINRLEGLPTSTSSTFSDMAIDIGGPVGNMMTDKSLSSDFFCDGYNIVFILDPR